MTRSIFRENIVEAAIGAVVLIVAVWFVVFAYNRTSGASSGSGYTVSARFPNVSGISSGTDVRLSGMKVGSVKSAEIDPKTYQAVLKLSLDSSVRLPADTAAAITSEGILGGNYISLQPGGDPRMLKNGDEITETQGSVDLMGMIGQFVNRSGGTPDAGAGAAPAK